MCMLIEIWGHVDDTGYQVSNLGRVRNSRKMILSESNQGKSGKYLGVNLYSAGSKVKALVHRLVASEFWAEAKEENQDTVNHLDHDPSNNIAHNLAWASRVEQEAWKKLKPSQEGGYSGAQ